MSSSNRRRSHREEAGHAFRQMPVPSVSSLVGGGRRVPALAPADPSSGSQRRNGSAQSSLVIRSVARIGASGRGDVSRLACHRRKVLGNRAGLAAREAGPLPTLVGSGSGLRHASGALRCPRSLFSGPDRPDWYLIWKRAAWPFAAFSRPPGRTDLFPIAIVVARSYECLDFMERHGTWLP